MYIRDLASSGSLMYMLIAAAVFVCVFIMAIIRLKTKIIMTVMLVVFAALFFLATPNGSMHDEELHFYRAFQVAEGKLTADDEGGGLLPEHITEFRDPDAELGDQEEHVSFPTSAIYSPVSYLPQSVGMRIAMFFTRNVSAIFTWGRVANMIVCMALCIFAIWKMPWAEELIFLIMMFPMTMQEFVTMSADGLTIALALAFISYILHITYTKTEIKAAHIVLLCVLGIWVSVIKVFYVVLVALIFIIPKARFKSSRKALLFKILLCVAAVLVTVIWMVIASRVIGSGQRGDVFGQAGYMFSHIPNFLSAMVRSFHGNAGFYAESMIGSKLGALNIDTSAVMWVGFLILFVYECAASGRVAFDIRKVDRILYVLVFLAGAVMIFAGLYMQWTSEIGSAVVDGVQGRYFTPLILLPALCLAYHNRKANIFRGTWIYILTCFFSLLALTDILR